MRHLPGLLFLLLAALPFLGRSDAPPPSPGGEAEADGAREPLVIVSPHRRELREEYTRAFIRHMAGRGRAVAVAWRDPGGGTEAILRDLAARHAQQAGPGADLFFGGGVMPHMIAKDRGWSEAVRLPPELLAAVPPMVAGQATYDPEGHWFGVALASFGIMADRARLESLGLPLPREWADLADPALAGWLASGNPQTSGVVHACYETILQAYGFEEGWRLLARIAANTRVFGESASVAPTEVASGDAAAGMSIENYAETAIRNAENPDLVFILPAGLTQTNADAISLLRRAPHAELAREFIAYVLSAEGQRLLVRPAGVDGQLHTQRRYPVRRDLYDGPDAPPVNPYAVRQRFVYDPALGSLRNDVVNDLAGTWLIDTHPYLARAWRAVAARGLVPAEIEALTRPPLSEAESRDLAVRWKAAKKEPGGEDRLARERTLQRRAWAIAARERYRALVDPPVPSPAASASAE